MRVHHWGDKSAPELDVAAGRRRERERERESGRFGVRQHAAREDVRHLLKSKLMHDPREPTAAYYHTFGQTMGVLQTATIMSSTSLGMCVVFDQSAGALVRSAGF